MTPYDSSFEEIAQFAQVLGQASQLDLLNVLADAKALTFDEIYPRLKEADKGKKNLEQLLSQGLICEQNGVYSIDRNRVFHIHILLGSLIDEWIQEGD